MSDTRRTKAQLREEVNALRQSEERYRGILDGLMEGFQIVGKDWRYLYVNDAAARHRRRKREELLGRTMMEVYPGIEETALFAAMQTAMNIQTPHRMENEFLYPDGSSAWFELNIQPMPEGISILSIDITDRKRAEMALRESEERFRSTFEQAAVGIAHVSLNGSFLRVNDKLCAMLGYSPEELLLLKYTDITHPQDVELDVSFHEKLIAGQLSDYSLEKRYAGKGRNRVWVNLFVSLVSDTDGKPGYFVSVVEDITARKQAEEEIRRIARELALRNRIAEVFLTERGEEMYARVLDIIREEFGSEFGVFGFIDEKGGLVVPTMTRGVWGQCQVPDKRITFPRETWGRSSWPTAIREKRVISSNEPSTVTPEGHITITRHISQPIIHLGDVIGLIQVANKDSDYTDEDLQLLQTISGAIAPVLYARIAQERHDARLSEVMDDLARSNKELEQFAYVASHDLQEPLRMVASYTQLLERRYKDQLDETANEFIAYAVEGSNRMQRLIQDLLAYSRVTTKGKEFAEADLEEALAEAKANLQTAIEETGAEIAGDPLPAVKADYGQMVQLLQNLISNAIKFHGEASPRVRISVEEKPADWVFSVKDNGIGIDPQYFDRVFVIFQRLQGRADYPGTGIGLALCRRIVHRHGGKIWIESEPGQGSTFYFSLPKRR